MRRPSRSGPASPLFAFGVVMTAAGAVRYLLPASTALPLLALGALALATAAAVWTAARWR
ncbi:hypothetical protein ACIA6C_29790 [Streptomyces sp. NPDC051578]|uniref:hypothetical protein n=1 Tax=Streptomyces sp. NPDC051578 TaxID=3365662 RepID=UPI00378A7098